MLKTDTYSAEAFNKFTFMREQRRPAKPRAGDWTDWEVAPGLPEGWKVGREGGATLSSHCRCGTVRRRSAAP